MSTTKIIKFTNAFDDSWTKKVANKNAPCQPLPTNTVHFATAEAKLRLGKSYQTMASMLNVTVDDLKPPTSEMRQVIQDIRTNCINSLQLVIPKILAKTSSEAHGSKLHDLSTGLEDLLQLAKRCANGDGRALKVSLITRTHPEEIHISHLRQSRFGAVGLPIRDQLLELLDIKDFSQALIRKSIDLKETLSSKPLETFRANQVKYSGDKSIIPEEYEDLFLELGVSIQGAEEANTVLRCSTKTISMPFF